MRVLRFSVSPLLSAAAFKRVLSTFCLALCIIGEATAQDSSPRDKTVPSPQAEEEAGKSLPTETQRAPLIGDPKKGRQVFNRCRACHSLAEWDSPQACVIGPSLRQLFGREVGSLKQCRYSNALLTADFIWTPDRLEQWLKDPAGYLPGNRMAFQSLDNAQARADLIAYLKQDPRDR